MVKALFTLMFTMLLLVACKPKSDSSETKTSREARYLIGSAEDFKPEILDSIDEQRLAKDWAYQRETSWTLWSDLTQNVERGRASFVKWQTWYSKEDLQRIFRQIYGSMTKEERASRKAFTPEHIEAGLKFHDHDQYLDPSWNTKTFETWFAKFDSEQKKTSIPGLNKVLMNRTALVFFMTHYMAIDACTRTDVKPCEAIHIPEGAAFIKTAWRRGQGDFLVPYYQTNFLNEQFAAAEWQQSKAEIPSDGTSYHLDTVTGQIYHLVGVHLTLKLKESWLWTSIWLDADEAKTVDTKPAALSPLWNNYKLCSVNGYEPLANQDSLDPFESEIAKNESRLGASWCSSPYLEGGINNHQTNCIGCHQHAGESWTEEVFNDQLQNNLALVTQKSKDSSSSDFLWSLFNGPEPFASFISQEVDYFDVYDLY
ncbi:MAG: hypothetical protein EOP07_16730 [Proteobacteria bacterium]|nr:MAG: hypothetical protein EOP07_16730 [Pseudomonadota bacterium]